ncbi:MAG: Bug family tripartite tricarboxylate transporter substrate binding protein [Burkholderiales bacterium]|nr:Bug family tripartite tricarboxylate transporter substrate binding protein [Burkholderiales bacterium]
MGADHARIHRRQSIVSSHRRRFLAAAGAVLGAAGFARAGIADPDVRRLRILVGFPPGGSADVVARLLADRLRVDGDSAWVENRSGAGGRIGLDVLKPAPADGRTFIVTPASAIVVYPHVYRKLTYDALRDFVPITSVCRFQFALSVGPAVPPSVRTFDDFARWCRANPAQALCASPAPGSMAHFTGTLVARALGIDLGIVQYKGGAPAITELVGGHMPASINVISEALPHRDGGRLRILATTGTTRSPLLPDVPTFKELGHRELEVHEWFGAFAPAGTPPDVVARTNAAIRDAAKSDGMAAALGKLGFEPAGEPQPAFVRIVKAEFERWAPIVKSSGFSPDD